MGLGYRIGSVMENGGKGQGIVARAFASLFTGVLVVIGVVLYITGVPIKKFIERNERKNGPSTPGTY